MAQKINPIAFRLGITKDWTSRWFNLRKYKDYLEEDLSIRDFLRKRLQKAGVENIIIERSINQIKIIIRTSRPGLIIGRGGTGIEDIKTELTKQIFKFRGRSLNVKQIRLEVEEIKKPETYANLVAQNIADQLERRMAFRRVMKRTMDRVMSNQNVKGAKIEMAGRLGGAEMARREKLKVGRLPLQTLRADIDYAHVNANTSYGVIGVKVWIYRGEIL